MPVLFGILLVLLAWTASLFDWMVTYATSFAQLGVWITLFSLISGWTLWIALKKQPFTESAKAKMYTLWSVQLKS